MTRELKLHEFSRVKLYDANPLAKAKLARGDEGLIPFRAPHYSCSTQGIRDECRLAAGGILYLDEAANFSRAAVAAVAGCLRNGPRFGPALVILDGRPLIGTGIDKPSATMNRVHDGRLSSMMSVMNDAINGN